MSEAWSRIKGWPMVVWLREMRVLGKAVVTGFGVALLSAWDDAPEAAWWAWAILMGGWASYTAWRAANERTEAMRAERNVLQARIEEAERVSLAVEQGYLEPLPPDGDKCLMVLDVTNNGPDSTFTAQIGQVFGLPQHMPPDYGHFALAWSGSVDEAVLLTGGGRKRKLNFAVWKRSRYEMAFNVPHWPPVLDRNCQGPAFSPPGTVQFELEIRDVARGHGKRWNIYVDFDDPESGLPSSQYRIEAVTDATD